MSLLEIARQFHEEIERLERLVTKELHQREALTLFQQHRIRNMIATMTSTSAKLVDIYQDKDNGMKDEIAALGGKGQSSPTATCTVFSAFYDRLKEIHTYHTQHPNAAVTDPSIEEEEELLKKEPRIEFSGEEACGRYLDLHELYNEYNNCKFESKPIEYSDYLNVFSQTEKIPNHLKLTRRYREYLEHVLKYLISFFERTRPLDDLHRIFSTVEAGFEELWTKTNSALDYLEYYNSVEELMQVGPEKLKEGLCALGLKSGGTVKERAERLFLTKHTPLENRDKRHFSCTHDDSKQVALMEAKTRKVCELLHEVIVRTKENVEKKQTLTYMEIEAEREGEKEVEAENEIDDDEEQNQIYNPKNLPLDLNGKPIPYWQYKLHGLGQEFQCEICGNQSYYGRRAYEKHFNEWRHQHGMRCLGLHHTGRPLLLTHTTTSFLGFAFSDHHHWQQLNL